MNVSDDLYSLIRDFVDYLNTTDNGLSEDCYRTEIDCEINWEKTHDILSEEDADVLKEYYVFGGIYDRSQRDVHIEDLCEERGRE